MFVPLTAVLAWHREYSAGTFDALRLAPLRGHDLAWGRCLWIVRAWGMALLLFLPVYAVLSWRIVVDYEFWGLGRIVYWLLPQPHFLRWPGMEESGFTGLPEGFFPSAMGLEPTDGAFSAVMAVSVNSALHHNLYARVVEPLRFLGDLILIFYLSAAGSYAGVRCQRLPQALLIAYALGPGLYLSAWSVDVPVACLWQSRSLAVVLSLLCLAATIGLPALLLRRAGDRLDGGDLKGPTETERDRTVGVRS
jgi:hypothetical protein